MAYTREEQQSDETANRARLELLARYPDVIIWQDPNGQRYSISAKVNFLKLNK